jgi:hypothetical protein
MNRTMQLVSESASNIQADSRGRLVVAHDGGGSRRKGTTTTTVTSTTISIFAADKSTITQTLLPKSGRISCFAKNSIALGQYMPQEENGNVTKRSLLLPDSRTGSRRDKEEHVVNTEDGHEQRDSTTGREDDHDKRRPAPEAARKIFLLLFKRFQSSRRHFVACLRLQPRPTGRRRKPPSTAFCGNSTRWQERRLVPLLTSSLSRFVNLR